MLRKTYHWGVMKERNLFLARLAWRLVIALILAASLSLTSPASVLAQNPADYFEISYGLSLSKTEIHGDEVFYATAEGSATCLEDLPVPVSEAEITSRVVAEHKVSGAKKTLNSSYTVNIKPFPRNKGDTTEISKVIPLQFPSGSEAGDYEVVGELIQAKVKVLFIWQDVTAYLPRVMPIGLVKYNSWQTYSLTINVIGQGTTSPSPGSYSYNAGTQMTITATPAAGWRFDRWGGDASGASSSTSLEMTGDKSVTAYFKKPGGGGANRRPIAAPDGPYQATVGTAINFDGSASSDPDGDSLSYSWDFGDGATGRGVMPSHVYTSAGSYTITLIVNDGRQDSLLATTAVNVGEGNVSPTTEPEGPRETIIEEAIAPPPPAMHLASIDLSLVSNPGERSEYVRAIVTAVDANNKPVAGATVSGHWEGATRDRDSAITDSKGRTVFSSDEVETPPKGTTFTLVVDEVAKDGWVYDAPADQECRDSISVVSSTPSLVEPLMNVLRELGRRVLEIIRRIRDLATCQFTQRQEWALFIGLVGVGKSHAVQALVHQACRMCYKVLYMRTSRLLADLGGRGHADGTWESHLRRYSQPDPLILDDFAIKEFTLPQAEDIYELIRLNSAISLDTRAREYPLTFSM